MTTTLLHPSTPPRGAPPQRRRFTRDEYYQMERDGFFLNQRAERIEGEIIVMSPQEAGHYFGTDAVYDHIRQAFGDGFWVRSQAPLQLGLHSDPEPDVSVVKGSRADYPNQHPTTAVLVVEVSESTLKFDRTEKASLYAQAGIQDYWIVNLVDRQIEVYREPKANNSKPSGFGYAPPTIHKPGESISPLAKPTAKIEVAPLFPPT